MTRELPDPRLHPERSEQDVEILVSSQEFDGFSAWIDAELEKLEARWLHLAAPGASKPGRQIKQQPVQGG